MCECWSRRKQTRRVCIILLHHWWLRQTKQPTLAHLWLCWWQRHSVSLAWHLLIQCVNEMTSWLLMQPRHNSDKTKFVVLKSPAWYSLDLFYNQQTQPGIWADTLSGLTRQWGRLLLLFFSALLRTAICSWSAESVTEFCHIYLVQSNLETVSHDSVTVSHISWQVTVSHDCHSASWQCHCASWCYQMSHGIVAVLHDNVTMSHDNVSMSHDNVPTSYNNIAVSWHCHMTVSQYLLTLSVSHDSVTISYDSITMLNYCSSVSWQLHSVPWLNAVTAYSLVRPRDNKSPKFSFSFRNLPIYTHVLYARQCTHTYTHVHCTQTLTHAHAYNTHHEIKLRRHKKWPTSVSWCQRV